MQATEKLLLFAFPSLLSLSASFLSPYFQLSSRGSFLYLNLTSPELLHCLTQTLCPHLSDSTPLRKTLLADHCLRINSLNRYLLKNGSIVKLYTGDMRV